MARVDPASAQDLSPALASEASKCAETRSSAAQPIARSVQVGTTSILAEDDAIDVEQPPVGVGIDLDGGLCCAYLARDSASTHTLSLINAGFRACTTPVSEEQRLVRAAMGADSN